MKNPLMSEVNVSDLFLKCIFLQKSNPGEIVNPLQREEDNFTAIHQEITLKPKETKEIILEVIPRNEGDLVIQGIYWQLFKIVQCNYFFPTDTKN